MTFSVVVSVPEHGLLGAAAASFSLGVGNSVPAVLPGVGAVVSQAWTNRSLRGRGLTTLTEGGSPAEYVGRLSTFDNGYRLRQVALVSASGALAAHTGAECTAWAGSREAAGLVAVGNLLAGPETLDAMVARISAASPTTALELAAALVDGLRAGQERGGDVRGEQSTVVLVGGGAVQEYAPPDLDVDLRVDDHPTPIDELARLLALREAHDAAILDRESARPEALRPRKG